MNLVICVSDPTDANLAHVQEFGRNIAEQSGGRLAYSLFSPNKLGSDLSSFYAVTEPAPASELTDWSQAWWRMSQWLNRAILTQKLKADTVLVTRNLSSPIIWKLVKPRENTLMVPQAPYSMIDHVDPSFWIADVPTFTRTALFWKFVLRLETRHLTRLVNNQSPDFRRNHIWRNWLYSQAINVEVLEPA